MATVNEKMTAIADAIRDKTGKTDALTLDNMAEDISRVYESGQKAQYDEFWDNFQDNGNRTNYSRAFGKYWNDAIFNPKYAIKPVGTIAYIFAYSGLTDIAKLFADSGVEFDTSEATAFNEFASYSSTISHLPAISTVGASSLDSIFYNNGAIHTIDKLIFKDDGSQTWASSAFNGLASLVNIRIEGKIGASLNLSKASKLSYESLAGEEGFINALYDYSETTETRTLTLHATAKAKLSESDIAVITQKGWTLA